MMQNAAKISPTNFRVTSVLGTKREGDETTRDEIARGRNDLHGTKRQRDETTIKPHYLIKARFTLSKFL